MPLGEQNAGQRGARPRPFVHRQPRDPARLGAKEQLHAHHRTAAADAGVGNDAITGPTKQFDRRDQGHVELPRRELVSQTAGQVIDDVDPTGRQAVDEWTGVEVLHGPDPRNRTVVRGIQGESMNHTVTLRCGLPFQPQPYPEL